MSSLESSGFPSPLPPEGMEPTASEPLLPLAPLQPFDEMQPAPVEAALALEPLTPLQPPEEPPVEAVQQPETLQYAGVQPVEPLQPAMPPLPLLNGAEPAAEPVSVVPAQQSPEEIANLGVPLGTLIFRAGLLTEEQLEDALQEGVRTGKRLGEVLLESGLIGERDLGRLLADQKGLRFVELGFLAPDPAAIALLSAEKAHMFAALPIGFEDGVPLVAVADPSNELVTENLRRALGQDPRLVVASRSDLHAAIDRFHGAEAQDQEEPAAEQQVPVTEPVPVHVEPVRVEPVQVEPVQVEPVQAAPIAEEPIAVEPIGVEPVVAEPAAIEPLVVEPQPVASEPAAPAAFDPAPAAEVEPLVPVVEPVHSNGSTAEAPPALPTPEPVAEQAAEPQAEAEPVELEPAIVEPVLAPVVAEVVQQPEPEQTFSRIEEEEAAPEQHAQPEPPSALSYDVSLRLSDGERVPIGSFSEPEKAREYARDVVKHLSDETDGWPFFSGRFMRPDTILSVDIVPVGEPDRWLGSSVRANWASRLNR